MAASTCARCIGQLSTARFAFHIKPCTGWPWCVEEMDTAMKRLCLLALLAVAGIAGMERADGAGECGRVPVDRVAFQVVTPCGAATRDAKVVVPGRCCAAVQRFGRNPICLCAIMLSTTSKNAGVKPEIAVTIPKRCNLADRPVGYKCGGQSVER
ncbi:unnamed protein product [Musa acuminata subsp. malaccensis]|uniref:(wild Malaysian banana) hypothetical protein n=1 Tax=Musa acuminata subsp. malaccensis TaxID=214687 RepID=A0A8D7AUQ9_MUSAM|nr:unnamed protein product [Musa acuminata subsp. malaccensis]